MLLDPKKKREQIEQNSDQEKGNNNRNDGILTEELPVIIALTGPGLNQK